MRFIPHRPLEVDVGAISQNETTMNAVFTHVGFIAIYYNTEDYTLIYFAVHIGLDKVQSERMLFYIYIVLLIVFLSQYRTFLMVNTRQTTFLLRGNLNYAETELFVF